MKKVLFPLILLISTGCLDSSVEEYDDTADLAFYEEYRQRSDVQLTDSGLLYRVIEEGEGDSPSEDLFSFVRYQGSSVDDEIVFTSNDGLDIFLPEEMTTFRGLAEGIQLMSVGAVYEFVVPSNLATGDGRVFTFNMELDSFLIDPDEFLSQNAQIEDITETNSGLQYRILEDGQGEPAQEDDVILVNYTGSYTNGFVFDESQDGPAQFSVSNVIPGFSEGLQLMTPGSVYEIFVPSDIGYGTNPPQGILPGAVLVFEIELVQIVE